MDAKLKKIFDGRGKKYHTLIFKQPPTVDEMAKKMQSLK